MKKPRPTASSPYLPTAIPAVADKRRILLVDDHPFMRAGLAQLIDRQPDLRVVGEAGNPVEATERMAETKVDLVLTDITMPGRSGLDFIKDLQALHPQLPILVVSMHDELIYAERVLRAGARGYIMKEAGGENLLAAIRQVLRGERYVSARVSAGLVEAAAERRPRGGNSPISKLSDREFEIFQLIGEGKTTRAIAEQLHLSSKTVDVHRASIKSKLGLEDVTALVRHAVRWVETQKLD